MALSNAPGGVPWLWAAIYALVGMYVLPLLWGFIVGFRKSKTDK